MGGRLVLRVDPGARVVGWPRITIAGGPRERPPVLRLTLGAGSMLGANLSIDMTRAESSVVLGRGARVRDGAWIQLDGGRIVLGDRVVVGAHCSLQAHGDLRLEEDARLGPGCTVNAHTSVRFGQNAGCASGCTVIDTDHDIDGSDESFTSRRVVAAAVEVGSNTLVSSGSRVLRGADIGRNSVVGANSVVRAGRYPPFSVLAGVPATVRRRYASR